MKCEITGERAQGPQLIRHDLIEMWVLLGGIIERWRTIIFKYNFSLQSLYRDITCMVGAYHLDPLPSGKSDDVEKCLANSKWS